MTSLRNTRLQQTQRTFIANIVAAIANKKFRKMNAAAVCSYAVRPCGRPLYRMPTSVLTSAQRMEMSIPCAHTRLRDLARMTCERSQIGSSRSGASQGRTYEVGKGNDHLNPADAGRIDVSEQSFQHT